MLPTIATAGLALRAGSNSPLTHQMARPHSNRVLHVRASIEADGNSSSSGSGSDDGVTTFGDVLAAQIQQQQLRMPAADQLQAYEATLDSMLDRGSADLADVFDVLSNNLTVAAGNTSQTLNTELANAKSLVARRLDALPNDLPGRQEVQEELMALREAEAERELERARLRAFAGFARGNAKPDGWWADMMASGGGMMALLQGSAQWMGLLLVVGGVDQLGASAGVPGLPIGRGFYLNANHDGASAVVDLRATLTTWWAIGFGGGLFAYLCALSAVVYSPPPPSPPSSPPPRQ